jgi:ribosomal protein L32
MIEYIKCPACNSEDRSIRECPYCTGPDADYHTLCFDCGDLYMIILEEL